MPYIRTDTAGNVISLHRDATPDAHEQVAASDPRVLAFLGMPRGKDGEFLTLDLDLIRVIEDVVDVLIDRGLLRLTDLPPDAQRKLLARKGARARLRQGLNLLGPDDVI